MRSLALLAIVTACQSHSSSGLAPAEQWNAPAPAPAPAPAAARAPHGMIGTDVSKMGLPPPDPNRKVDLKRHVRGVIKPAPPLTVTDGTAVFVVAKHADAAGKPTGSPLAVTKLTWSGKELQFQLSDANAMIAGTQLDGDVVVTAHYDHDGDALTKQPGDLVAQARLTVPSDDVVLVLTPIAQ